MLLVTAVLSACASVPAPRPSDEAPPPWEAPVDGAVDVTAWQDDGQPTAPFGPGGPAWSSPESLITEMARALAASGGIESTARVTGRNESGTVEAGIRLDLVDADGSVLAGDLRVEMRNDGGSWFVVNVRSREYCAVPLVDGKCR